jgi:hypothetical protein
MAYRDNAYIYCRTILGIQTSDMSDTTLAVFVGGVEADLILAYPCCGSAGVTTLGSTDLTYFTEALGYALAARVCQLPAAQSVIAPSTEVEIGPVKRKFGVTDPLKFAQALMGLSQKAMVRIGCVRTNAAAQAPNLSFYALTGPAKSDV